MKMTLKESIQIFGRKFGKYFFTLAFITSYVLVFYGGKKSNTNIVNNLNCANPPVLSLETNNSESQCLQGGFEKLKEEWDLGNYKIESDNSICANILSGFLTPIIWLENSIPVNFQLISFSYFPGTNKQKKFSFSCYSRKVYKNCQVLYSRK
jgi:hypothetical protein